MGYEYENSNEREYLSQICRAIHNLKNELGNKDAPVHCFEGISEIETWTDHLTRRIKFAYSRNQIQNAPYRSPDSETAIDKQD